MQGKDAYSKIGGATKSIYCIKYNQYVLECAKVLIIILRSPSRNNQ